MSKIAKVNPIGEIESDQIAGSNESSDTDSGHGSRELPGMHVFYRLDGKNYLQWAQLVRTFLKGQGKLGHLTISPPNTTDPVFLACDIEDSLIMSWLWNAMQAKINKNYMLWDSAKTIWDTIRQTYSKVKDASVIFDIKTKINSTQQAFLTITEYFNKMNGLWLELD